MKWENKIWIFVSFFIGVLISYLSLQFSYFSVKKELDIPNIIISVITLLIGLFIAVTLQKKVNKGQNQHSYLTSKLDLQWNYFNDFSEKLLYDDKVDLPSIKIFIKKVIHPTSFLKKIFASFNLDDNCVFDLELKLEQLETKLSNSPATDNVVDLKNNKVEVENEIIEINNSFAIVLKQIQEV